eukprot:240713-Alexandrium_andersonii.AAC.1
MQWRCAGTRWLQSAMTAHGALRCADAGPAIELPPLALGLPAAVVRAVALRWHSAVAIGDGV